MFFGREAAGAAQGVVDEPLELAVDRAELVGGPFLQGFHRGGVYAEHETFGLGLLFCHLVSIVLLVERAGVEYGLGGLVGAENHEQIADHGGLLGLVQLYDILVVYLLEGHLHHGYGTLDYLLAGGDDGLGLLAAQHDGRDLGCVGEVVDAGLEYRYAGHLQALVEFLDQLAVDGIASAAQGNGVGLLYAEVVVGVVAGHLAQGRVALYADEGLEGCHYAFFVDGDVLGVYLEDGLVDVLDLPYEDEADEDGVAVAVIDLDGVHVDVAGAERDFLLGVEGIDPEEAGAGEGAAVFAEEYHGPGLVRLKDHETYKEYGRNDEEENGGCAENAVDSTADGGFIGLCDVDESDAGGNQEDADKDHQKSVACMSLEGSVLCDFGSGMSFHGLCDIKTISQRYRKRPKIPNYFDNIWKCNQNLKLLICKI